MPLSKPFKRTWRPRIDDKPWGFYGEYISHAGFAREPQHYIRAFTILQKDLDELFDYVEPADENLPCYSYRIHALHMRVCIEVEANWKAVLTENGYPGRSKDWKVPDYRKLEPTHRLSEYDVMVPNWRGTRGTFRPFEGWATANPLPWYQAYNAAKHDRHEQFAEARLEHLVGAMCGLTVLMSAQFGLVDFGPDVLLGDPGPEPLGWHAAIGGRFYIKFPTSWADFEKYDFDWKDVSRTPDPFQNLVF